MAATHDNANDATATLVEEETKTDGEAAPAPAPTLVLRLNPRPHISFSNDTVDNEHLGRKSSKRCCIYHKKRPFGESSTESDSDCDDPDCRKNKSIAHKKKSHDDGVEEAKEEPSPSPAPAPALPGAGWGRPKKDRVPDYQRFHA